MLSIIHHLTVNNGWGLHNDKMAHIHYYYVTNYTMESDLRFWVLVARNEIESSNLHSMVKNVASYITYVMG